jgi:hypothetical protein
MVISLVKRRFFCGNTSCTAETFTDRLEVPCGLATCFRNVERVASQTASARFLSSSDQRRRMIAS